MLRHKDVISVLLGAVAVAGVDSKSTFAKLVHLYFSSINNMKSDIYLFMRNISLIRDRISAKNFPECRNLWMLNYRTVVCRTRPITHDVHCNVGSSNQFLITSVFSLAPVCLLSKASVVYSNSFLLSERHEVSATTLHEGAYSVLDTSAEFCICKTCRWLWRLFRNCREVLASAN